MVTADQTPHVQLFLWDRLPFGFDVVRVQLVAQPDHRVCGTVDIPSDLLDFAVEQIRAIQKARDDLSHSTVPAG